MTTTGGQANSLSEGASDRPASETSPPTQRGLGGRSRASSDYRIRVTIQDPIGIEGVACECYGVIRALFESEVPGHPVAIA